MGVEALGLDQLYVGALPEPDRQAARARGAVIAGWVDALELLDLSALPALNATLNGLATVLLIVGLALIRSRHERAHRRVMVSAFSVSCLFLALYVTHKVWRGFESTPFIAVGRPKLLYLIVLFTHVTLAADRSADLRAALPPQSPPRWRPKCAEKSHLFPRLPVLTKPL